jgi:hypothetical protein
MKKISLFSTIAALITIYSHAQAVECNFNEGPVSYTVELNHATNALVMYGQQGASGNGYELSYSGTGPGGASIYQNGNGIKMFVLNQNGSLNLKLMDTNAGEILFQNKICKNSAAIDSIAVAKNVEVATISNQQIMGIVSIIEKSNGMKCSLSKGMTKVSSKEVKNEDYGTTSIETAFETSFGCSDLQYNAYAGRIDIQGSFLENGNQLTLKTISIERGGN